MLIIQILTYHLAQIYPVDHSYEFHVNVHIVNMRKSIYCNSLAKIGILF